MVNKRESPLPKPGKDARCVRDQYGNEYRLSKEHLSKGGQGAVYTTDREDYIVKQPNVFVDGGVLGATKAEIDRNIQTWDNHFQNIRILPLPPRIQRVLTLPVAVLDGEPGYVMRMLTKMQSFEALFELDGQTETRLRKKSPTLPAWMSKCPENAKWVYYHYAQSGASRARLYALYRCAAALARLHAAGIVYGDISPKNAFISDRIPGDFSLIDADNIRLEGDSGSNTYTPGYGAPELVSETSGVNLKTDVWAFAVLAFKMLSLQHPFYGKQVYEYADSSNDFGGGEEQAHLGKFPYIDDTNDRSNAWVGPLPREWLFTHRISRLFEETFCAGRTAPWRRPSMSLWAYELARAFDDTLVCPHCGMGFYSEQFDRCPYCDPVDSVSYFRLTKPGGRWHKVYQVRGEKDEHIPVPRRLVQPFSVLSGDDTYTRLRVDLEGRRLRAIKGEEGARSLKQEYMEASHAV